ncbi:MAG: ATP-binding cassette domain-containing protein [Undibacterium sp.]|nr:ATP-binding cassette domain-containing protein [Undibacterium sp.]
MSVPFVLNVDLNKRLDGAEGAFNLEVNFDIPLGSFLALYGASGAGKTSVLRMLAGLAMPDQGYCRFNDEIWLDSKRKIALPPQHRRIGMVFQDSSLFPHLNVRENIAFAANREDRREGKWVDELLHMMGLDGLQARSVDKLSGGQKQRVALARALARKPQLLLLDEPLSGLDQSTRIYLQRQLKELHQTLKLTTVLVSHDLAEVFALADQVIELERGKLLRSGTPSEVFLQKKTQGKLNLQGQVLALRQEEIICVLTLLVGQEIVEIIAAKQEIDQLQVGDLIAISTKAFSPQIVRVNA